MSTITTAPPLPAIVPPLPVQRFTVDQYHQMIQTGVLSEDDDVELLQGWIVPKMGRNPPRDAVISMIMIDVLSPPLPSGWFCRGQSAITTFDSEPEPDIAVVRGVTRDYLTRHPRSYDMALIIEFADFSLPRDRSHEAWIYAAAAVPVYWIINLLDHQVEVCSNPTGPDPAPVYHSRRDYRDDELVPLIINDQNLGSIAARELLP